MNITVSACQRWPSFSSSKSVAITRGNRGSQLQKLFVFTAVFGGRTNGLEARSAVCWGKLSQSLEVHAIFAYGED